LLIVLLPLLAALGLLAAFLIHVAIRYTPIVGRIFEEKPLFLPLRVAPVENDGEEVRFLADDGLELGGTYLPCRSGLRIGVLVFCHEYLSDRWSYLPYIDALRDLGFDIFTFDFRNHGSSASDPRYRPLQWVTDHEAADLRGALRYLRSRADRDPAGVGLFGISRGGGTALVVAAGEPGVWGVITDGAFPTRGTMLAYILRWAEIYVGSPFLWKRMPLWVFSFVGWVGRMNSQRRLHCRFPDVEQAVAALSPRPWLMIHGAKDAYIGPEIARLLFAEAREPKELWIVPGAKHNRCREVQPEAYAEQVASFLGKHAPRRPLPQVEESPAPDAEVVKRLSSSAVL
jgi:pimeloyl-ACP methyl ester carboxylesterase